ncbi:MAG: Protein of unknown function, rane YfhO [Gemmatimonadetes bacterium]|nr:Protein of unknown function, rane YfhO [Gemmatimonadota bacterium]
MARTSDVTATAAPELPAPRHATAWASLVYAVATMLLAYPALTGAFLVSPISDQYKIGYAFREFAAASLKAGHGFPEWNSYLFGGLPYVAAMHGDIFYPTFLLRMIMPTDVAMTWEFAIHLFLAGLFTYGFLRAWGLGFMSSLIGGLAYMLSGQIASLASPGHDGKLFVSALLPAALWLLVRGVRDGRRWAWGLLAIVVGLAVLSPHPQLLQYMLLACGFFALFLAFGDLDSAGRLPRDVALKRLACALGAVMLGGAIGAIQYWPVLEYAPFSPRAGGRGYDFATSFSMPIEELINTYLPQFSGILDRYWGRNQIHFHSEYIGAAVLVLAGAAFGAGTRRSFRRFWVITGVVALFWALGGDTPFYRIVYALPIGTKFFRAPSTMFFVVSFAVAVLSALGVERILAGRVGRRYVIGWVGASLAFTILMSVGAGTVIMQAVTSAMADMYPPEQHAAAVDAFMQRASENSSALILGAWRSFFVVAIAGALIWALGEGRVSRRVAAWCFVALVGVDLWSIERLYWRFSPPAAQLYASDPATDYMAKAPDPGRVVVLEIRQLGNLAPQDPTLTGCSGGTGGPSLMVHRVRNVTGCHGNEFGRYQQLGGYTDATQSYDPARYLSPAGARHENVHFLLTNAADTVMSVIQTQLHTGPFTHVLGPVKTAAGSMVHLYRVSGDNPLAWVAASIVSGDSAQTLATVLSPDFDPHRAAIVDVGSPVATVPIQAVPAPATTRATSSHYEPGAIDINLDQPASSGQALVVSENYFPGWHATADGKPAVVARMNFNLIGIALPAGARSVQLRFDDAAYEKGKVLTLVALVLALGLWAWGAVVERRRPIALPSTT